MLQKERKKERKNETKKEKGEENFTGFLNNNQEMLNVK